MCISPTHLNTELLCFMEHSQDDYNTEEFGECKDVTFVFYFSLHYNMHREERIGS